VQNGQDAQDIWLGGMTCLAADWSRAEGVAYHMRRVDRPLSLWRFSTGQGAYPSMAEEQLDYRDLAAAGLLTYEEMVEAGLVEDERGSIRRADWKDFYDDLGRDWLRGKHASLFGMTGSGKSHLLRHLLELWRDARVLIVDVTDDDTLGIAPDARAVLADGEVEPPAY
jgi:Helicase HerA, central domain